MIQHPIPQPPHPRYISRPFPPYRFVVGENPHPTVDPQGHSFGHEQSAQILTTENWKDNGDYLYAIDLYNYAYWWEAHEALEGLWGNFPTGSAQSDLLQGLIKISAAFYKWHLHNTAGVNNHYTGGTRLLKNVLSHSPIYIGINLKEYLQRLASHFETVLTQPDSWPDPLINYPFIILQEDEGDSP